MKKILILVLAMFMVLGVLAACTQATPDTTASAAQSQGTSTAPAASSTAPAAASSDTSAAAKTPKFKIGFPFSTLLNNPTISACINAVKAACEGAGGEMILDTCNTKDIESYVTSMEKLISMGVNGLVILPPAESMIPTAIDICEKANVDFSLCFSPIQDSSIKDKLYASKNFAGYCWIDDEEAGYTVMKELAQLGCKNVAILGNVKGHLAGDNRDRGAQRAAQEFGVKILTEVRGLTDSAEIAKAVESFIVAYPKIDGIMSAGISWVDDAVFKVLSDYNMAGKVKFGKIDFFTGMDKAFTEGKLNVILGGHSEIDFQLSAVLLANKILGTPILDADKKVIALKIEFQNPKSAEEMQNYFHSFWTGVPPYTAEEIGAMFIKANDSSITDQTLVTAAKNFSINDVATRHAKLLEGKSDIYTIQK